MHVADIFGYLSVVASNLYSPTVIEEFKNCYEEGGESFLQVSFHNQHNLSKQNICCAGTSTKIQHGYMV